MVRVVYFSLYFINEKAYLMHQFALSSSLLTLLSLSSIVTSCSNPFLEQPSIKQWGLSFLLNRAAGAFGEVSLWFYVS